LTTAQPPRIASTMTPEDFAAAGLYDPSAPNAAERLELLEWLASRGVTTEQLQDADRDRRLMHLAGRLAARPGPFLSTRQVAERIGMPEEQVTRFRLAFGLPPIGPDAPCFSETEAQFFGRFADGVAVFGERAMQRLAMVIGSSLARITEAMISTNRESQLNRLARTGSREIEYAQANLRANEAAMAPAAIIQGLLPAHLELASDRARRHRKSAADTTTWACVGFVDLVGFTTLSRRLSPADLGTVVERFEDVSHEIATERRGRVVKFIGDEVMFVTGDAASACDIALALVERFADDTAVTPRGAVAAGEVLDRCGDYYGSIVNLAARLAELAVPREVLVSQEVADRSTGALRFEPAGRRLLRGFDEPVGILSVTRA
jgi:class 3 adenylate cyclase